MWKNDDWCRNPSSICAGFAVCYFLSFFNKHHTYIQSTPSGFAHRIQSEWNRKTTEFCTKFKSDIVRIPMADGCVVRLCVYVPNPLHVRRAAVASWHRAIFCIHSYGNSLTKFIFTGDVVWHNAWSIHYYSNAIHLMYDRVQGHLSVAERIVRLLVVEHLLSSSDNRIKFPKVWTEQLNDIVIFLK